MPLFTTAGQFNAGTAEVLTLLAAHHTAFAAAEPAAQKWGHTTPIDTKSWSQIIVSALTGLSGRGRKKGTDLEDGSDVKAANCWGAIDTPRFNGCLPAGRTTKAAAKPDDVTSLDDEPFLFFVLWDTKPTVVLPRCRIWVARPAVDQVFRAMAAEWYQQRKVGEITSDNFQLHPPRNLDSDVIRNTCGNLRYPLLFSAVKQNSAWTLETLDSAVLHSGSCIRT